MLSSYDFSNCDIPVRLNHFFLCELWSGCEGSPKIFFISHDRKLFWERQCSEEETTQSKCNNDLKRVPSSYRSLMEKLWQTEILYTPKRNLRITNQTRWRLSVHCWVSSRLFLFVTWLKPRAQTGLVCLWWWGCTVHQAWDVRATSPTDDHRSHTEATERAEGNLIQEGGREEGWCDCKLSKQTCVEEEKQRERTTLAEQS